MAGFLNIAIRAFVVLFVIYSVPGLLGIILLIVGAWAAVAAVRVIARS